MTAVAVPGLCRHLPSTSDMGVNDSHQIDSSLHASSETLTTNLVDDFLYSNQLFNNILVLKWEIRV